MPSINSPLTLYLRVVSAAGLALLVVLVGLGAGSFGPLDTEFWLLAALVLAGELFPIQVHGQIGEETFSTPFGFAMLLIYGVPEVVLVQAIASLAADVVGRRPADRILFNLAQLTISWAAAGAVLALLGGSGLGGAEGLQPEDLPAIAASAAVFFAVNSTFTRCGEALIQQTSIIGHLRDDLVFRSWSAATLFALGPPVAVIAEEWLYLVPALALPMAAVHRASRQASEMEHLALHDPLTSLPNRALLTQRTVQAIRRPTGGEGAAVLTLDLARFRDVNDTLGRDQGDALLIEVGGRLARTVRASDTVARIEGDRFAVLLPAVGGSADAEAAAVKILEALSRPFEVAGANLSVDASVGIACSPEHGDDAELLLQRAETAMSQAKRAQSRSELYRREMDAEAPRRLVLVSALKRALDERDMDLHYQPKVDLQQGRVVGVEALARWTDIGLGEVPPTTFVPLAERTGLAEQLTDLVLEIAGRDARRWREAGCAVPVAVNIPTRVLLDPALPGRVEDLKRRFGLDESSLEIEITEGTLIADHAQARTALAQLRAIGVRSSIDDFGTGYSSLAYLRELPVDALKIDRSFISDLANGESGEAIVRSIIELARNLGLETVAEGVEEESVRRRLAGLGCDCAQGFLLGRPMPAGKMLDWLRATGPPATSRRA